MIYDEKELYSTVEKLSVIIVIIHYVCECPKAKPRDSNLLLVLLPLANTHTNSHHHSTALYPFNFLHYPVFYVVEMTMHQLM